jgi:hypothetical protein
MAERDPIGNTPTMTTTPPPTPYHRWLGWYAPAMRRAVVVSSIGLIVIVVLVWFVPWEWPWSPAGTPPRSPSS